jgi:hypothetical protein
VIRAVGAGTAPSLRAALPARAAFALLVLASVAALFYAQVLKRRPPLVDEPLGHVDRFAPGGDGVRLEREAHFRFRTTVDDVVDVWVVTTAGRVVDSLETDLPMHAYRHRPLHWDGTTTSGAPAAPGTYELRVRLERAGQTLIVPGFPMALESPAA